MSDNQLMNPTAAASADGEMDEHDLTIKEIQAIRKKGIKDLMDERGGKLPKDVEDRAFIIQLMNGMTSTALGSKKIKAVEKSAATQASQVEAIVEAIRMNASANQAKKRKTLEERTTVPKLDVTLVKGHTDQGTRPIATTSVANGGDGHMETSKD